MSLTTLYSSPNTPVVRGYPLKSIINAYASWPVRRHWLLYRGHLGDTYGHHKTGTFPEVIQRALHFHL